MRKDKYEISLWKDCIVPNSYKETEDSQLKDDKKYHFYNEEKETYSAPIMGSLIKTYQSFPQGEWYQKKKDSSGNEIDQYIKAEKLNNTDFYYLKENNNYIKVYGETIYRYKTCIWYELDVLEHYEEEKICVIGSDSMEAPFRAREPRLVENINGTSTLTFKIFYTYIDTETGEKKDNPFIGLLVNERKVKAKWKNKWYHLVIKGIQEDSNGKSITYTCKDQFIHELSKTGFNLEFSNELRNNSGSINELAARVLEETDWQLETSADSIIRQTIEEPVYEVQTKNSFNAKTLDGEIIIPSDKKILVYYSIYNNKTTFFQFHYVEDEKYGCERNSMLVTNGTSCWIEGVVWSDNLVKTGNVVIAEFSSTPTISRNYRAKRLVKQQLSEYDPLTKTYCNVYTTNQSGEVSDDTKVYGYIGTRTTDATAVINLLANNGSTGFEGNDGYTQAPNKTALGMPLEWTPKVKSGISHYYLFFEYNSNNALAGSVRYLNSGIGSNTQYLEDGFSAGDTYIFRYKAAIGTKKTITVSDGIPSMYMPTKDLSTHPVIPKVGLYNKNTLGIVKSKGGEGKYIFSAKFIGNVEDLVYYVTSDTSRKEGKTYYTKNENDEYVVYNGSFQNNTYYYEVNNEPWIEWKIVCKESISRSEILSNDFGFIFGVQKNMWLQQAQFFKEEYGKDINGNEVRLNPNSIDGTMVAKPEYRYYYYKEAKNLNDVEELSYLYKGLVDISEADDETTDEDGNTYIPITLYPCYPKNEFEKIRSIEAKQSNRFNILQTLGETFESYPTFRIEEDENGKIIYENGTPKKFVCFKETISADSGLSFVYGIDLKTISRTINSDQIVTKTIVLNNNNSVAKNGFCSIARANDNLPKINYILNFDYYTSHGLIDIDKLNMDLYDTSEDSIGFYHKLREYNTDYDTAAEILALKQTEFDKLKSQLKVYEEYVSEANEQVITTITKIQTLTNKTFSSPASAENYGIGKKFQEVKDLGTTWQNLLNNITSYNKIIKSLKDLLYTSTNKYTCIEDEIKQQKEQQEIQLANVKSLEQRFYNKYSRYIQEGSWSSDQYMDDNLYYLDAQSVAYTSSRPQVQYNISVLRLSALEEFKNKVFKLGSVATVQDTEYFGYEWKNGIKNPYREEVLISEITSNFDSPENDSFKIQNYKTQFEDLFQRITATTQSLQYSEGEYKKAANVIESDGSIKASILQNSLTLNSNIMINYQNNAIAQDATGITLTDISNPNRKVKLTSGGIIFTSDGKSWKTGIDADGVRADYLTTGAINTNNIMIYSGAYPTFRWTSSGLDAYSFGDAGVKFNKFVRFDQYGVYGVQDTTLDEDGIWRPEEETDIWNTAQFGMTWKGFFMKNREGNGWVEVSSENDISVFSGDQNSNIQRVKIGRLGTIVNSEGKEEKTYGIRIKDSENNVVMETVDDGTLWLKNKLNVETYGNNNNVAIGKLDTEDTKNTEENYFGAHGGRVITASGNGETNFAVYEDGFLKANGVAIEGTINATGGQIGNLFVEDVEKIVGSKRIDISADTTSFINNSPDYITITATYNGDVAQNSSIEWSWYKGSVDSENIIDGQNSNQLQVSKEEISIGSQQVYSVRARYSGNNYEASIVLSHTSVSAELDLYALETSEQEILKFFKSTSEGLTFSPQNFGFVPKKGETILNQEEGYNFKIFIDNQEVGAKYHHWYEYIPVDEWSENVPTYFINESGEYKELTENPGEGHDLGQLYNIDNEDKYVVNIASFYNELAEEDSGLKNKEYSLLKVELQDVSERTVANFYYSITFGTSKDLASFSVHSTGITAAIQNTSLEFDTEGLTIYNGGFKIIEKDREDGKENTLLYYDEDAKQLKIVGNGTFTGNIYANDGEFNGTIKSSAGEIAGLIMEEIPIREKYYYEIAEVNEQEELSEKKEKTDIIEIEVLESHSILHDEQNNLYINGTTGAIETNNILIKSGARIESYLQLGNGFIKNPEWNQNEDRIFISTEKDGEVTFSLNDSGVIHMGKISIDGNTSLLKLGDEESTNIVLDGEESVIYGNKWNITPEVASFNKINITNGIFETGKIQSVGGSMIFKSSSLIKKWKSNNSFTLDSSISLKVDDWIKISNSNASNVNSSNDGDYDVLITHIEEDLQEKVYFINREFDNDDIFNYDTVTYLCSQIKTDDTEVNSALINNILIGVNTNDALVEGLAPRAFSFIEITKENNQLVYSSPKLIIGDLSAAKAVEAEHYEKSGFGLYGENVYLNGTLTTQVGTGSYAGVNTISGVEATKFGDYKNQLPVLDKSRIVFWAGAKRNDEDSIQNAPFQVTEAGSIYANNGIFEGAIISDSVVEGSVLRAAKIYSSSNSVNGDTTPALQIFNANEEYGIELWADDDNNSENENPEANKILTISTRGFKFKTADKNFIEFNESKVNGHFGNMELEHLLVDNIKIDNHKITYLADDKTTEYGFLKFKVGENKRQGWSLGIYEEEEKEILYYDSTSKKTLNSIDFQVTENVVFGSENNGGMEYKKILDNKNKIIGYDLYIS